MASHRGGGGALIRPVTAEEVRLLRHRVLRPDQPFDSTVYDGDELSDTVHLGAFEVDGEGGAQLPGTRLVGIASLYHEPRPGPGSPDGWRLRGMATVPEARGRGFGMALLAACGAHVAGAGGTELWCNARRAAVGFYRRGGFDVVGAEFEVPGLGPHVVMVRPLVP
ncbi:MAG: GNAT family N-acetyltransferase [Actinomycetota bacterium]|nr:GNAT family N-acetyltransferase [Actinomycetota bacterium]